MKLPVILAVGIGTLALAGAGGAYLLLPHEAKVEDKPVQQAEAAKPEQIPLGDDWHSLDNYLKIQQAAAGEPVKETESQARQRLARQAELRTRLNPPMLPVHLVADASVKVSPKSHWDLDAQPAAPPAASGALQNASAAAPAPKKDSLVSDHAKETVAMLEAFKTALRKTGGDKKFPMVAASDKTVTASPYMER